MNIYLAGGMKSEWQDEVMRLLPGNTFFDPRTHGFKKPTNYTIWDLFHIQEADLIFACFETTNPSGFGMTLEIGYAHAMKKPIVLVDEQWLRSWSMIHEVCNYVDETIENVCNYVKKHHA